MTSHITTPCLPQSKIETTGQLFDNWFDPIEAGLRDRAREFLQAMFEAELEEVLARSRYARHAKPSSSDSEAAAAVTGHRHGHRSRSLMIYAATCEEIETRRKAFIRKWRLKHRPVADSLQEAGDRLFTFTRLPPSQWRRVRTNNALGRLHEEFKRRIKTQTVLPSADTAAMLFRALLASGQINMRKVDGWQTLAT